MSDSTRHFVLMSMENFVKRWWVHSSTMLLNIVRASSKAQWSECESFLMPKGSQSLHITLLFEGKTLIENLSSYSTKIPLRIQETILSR